ncbi:FK506-binding protein 2-like [Actinia tenebrosa]|uniref:peptidylprolyl isomerase n=1 Tax=Actinia tenebrosa TaxID=6105 RepID=A0A6P8HPY9_ACTTE|nr:FK506-binding protein 2-like [Actinia tenebrosa]
MNVLLCIISLSLATVLQISSAEQAQLKIEVVEKPEKCPRKTKVGDTLAMHYTGRLKDGKKFDSSLDRGKTFDFTLGKGMVIQGWEQGLLDMCVGEKRKLIIPPHLAYGDNGAGAAIPPGATLYMDVELVEIQDSPQAQPDVFGMIDKDKNRQLTQEEIKTYLKEQNSMPNDDPASHDTIVSEIFQEEDKNKDGVISFEEFTGPKHEEL